MNQPSAIIDWLRPMALPCILSGAAKETRFKELLNPKAAPMAAIQ
jgi:hypothetical protein